MRAGETVARRTVQSADELYLFIALGLGFFQQITGINAIFFLCAHDL